MIRQRSEQDPYVLVVVDMQPDQLRPQDASILRAVVREIEEAKRRQRPIIALELADEDHRFDELDEYTVEHKTVPIGRSEVERPTTVRPILQLLSDYEHKAIRTKYRRNGAYEVVYACADRGWQKKSFRLVGMYAFSCVLYTARGLEALAHPHIEVVQDACGYDARFGANWWKFNGLARLVPPSAEAA